MAGVGERLGFLLVYCLGVDDEWFYGRGRGRGRGGGRGG